MEEQEELLPVGRRQVALEVPSSQLSREKINLKALKGDEILVIRVENFV